MSAVAGGTGGLTNEAIGAAVALIVAARDGIPVDRDLLLGDVDRDEVITALRRVVG